MITLKKSVMKYKDADGNMQDVGAMMGVITTDNTLTQSGQPADAKATGDSINQLSKEIDEHKTEVADQLDGMKVDIVQEVLAQLGHEAGSVFGQVNEDGTITITTDLAEGDYTIMYENEDGTVTEVGSITVGEYAIYSITRTLTGCTSNKSAISIDGGSAWAETITANSGYVMSSITVTMGGVDVTNSVYSGGVINIAEVTGNIVIMATAILPNYTNLADPTSSDWATDTRLRSSGVTASSTGALTTNYIACEKGDILRIKGLKMKEVLPDGTNYPQVCLYDSSKTHTGATLYPQSSHNEAFVESNGVVEYTMGTTNSGSWFDSADSIAYIRVCGAPIEGETVIITVNEEIA